MTCFFQAKIDALSRELTETKTASAALEEKEKAAQEKLEELFPIAEKVEQLESELEEARAESQKVQGEKSEQRNNYRMELDACRAQLQVGR